MSIGDRRRGRPKVFGIGLPRTGTTSLNNALTTLGLRSVHWPHDPVTVRQLRRGDYRLRILKRCDALTDIPVPAVFAQLDRAFPGSKFILTTRDRASWLESQKRAAFNANPPEPGTHRDFYRVLLYGTTHFSESRFKWVYDRHHALVEHHFRDRPGDLLRIDISESAKPVEWGPLCSFLGEEVPDTPYPHSNRGRPSESASA